jgi:hypothetical protein
MAYVTWKYSDLYYRRNTRDRFYNEIDGRYTKLLARFPQIINLTKEMEASQADYAKKNSVYKLFDNGTARIAYIASLRLQVFGVLVDYAEIKIYISRLKSESLLAEKKVIKDLLQDLERTSIDVTNDHHGLVKCNFNEESSMFSESFVGQHLINLRQEINNGAFDSYLFGERVCIWHLFRKRA